MMLSAKYTKSYCAKCAHNIFCTKENHHAWNPTLTEDDRYHNRRYPEYIEFIKMVMYRDNYTCQCCGRKSVEDLKVHHLDGYNWCIEKRTDVNNGITLCYPCHENFHDIYGKGNNTKEQYEEWIGNTIKLTNGQV